MQSRRGSARIDGGPSTTKEDCMGYATILGLDLGKFKSVCCAMDAATGRHAFQTLASTPASIHDLLTRHAAAANGEAANGEEVLLVEIKRVGSLSFRNYDSRPL